MGIKILEVIPCKNFRMRIRQTKELLSNGITPINLGNCLLINYNTTKRCYNAE